MDPQERMEFYKEVRLWVLDDVRRTSEEAATKFNLDINIVELIIERGYAATPWDNYEEYLRDTIRVI